MGGMLGADMAVIECSCPVYVYVCMLPYCRVCASLCVLANCEERHDCVWSDVYQYRHLSST